MQMSYFFLFRQDEIEKFTNKDVNVDDYNQIDNSHLLLSAVKVEIEEFDEEYVSLLFFY